MKTLTTRESCKQQNIGAWLKYRNFYDMWDYKIPSEHTWANTQAVSFIAAVLINHTTHQIIDHNLDLKEMVEWRVMVERLKEEDKR